MLGHPAERNVTTHVHYGNEELVSVVRSIVDPDTREVTGAVLIDLKRGQSQERSGMSRLERADI